MKNVKFMIICILAIATLAITSCSLMPQHRGEPKGDSHNQLDWRN